MFTKINPGDVQYFWEKILWTDELKAELLGRFVAYIWCKTNIAIHKKIYEFMVYYYTTDMVVLVWWSGAALLLHDLNDLL